ncbi:MAG: response regulator transcription factor [Janthinobacterium lividum]
MPDTGKSGVPKITVVIVDDHALVRQGVRAFLETQVDIEIVGEASSGAEAVRVCTEAVPDVVLMDLVMPDTQSSTSQKLPSDRLDAHAHLDGVEATREVKRISPRSQVIILTSYHDDEHILPAIHAGALSYLLKAITADELVNTVRMAARGEAFLHPHIASKVVKGIQQSGSRVEDKLTDLSDREMEVLRLIAEGLSNAAIAEVLVVSEKTVKSHVSNILSKLHLVDRTQAAVYAWRRGVVADMD